MSKKGQEDGYRYDCYHFTLREEGILLWKTLGIAAGIAYLFYHSFWAQIIAIGVYPLLKKRKRKQKIEQIREELEYQFKDAIQAVACALQAGYSIENAWYEAQKEMEQLYGEESRISCELQKLHGELQMNQPLERPLYSLAERSQSETIQNFCQIFQFARKSGGDFTRIVQNTVDQIEENQKIKREIATLLAAKQLEQKVMNVVPLGILFYMELTSPDYMEPLYRNPIGIGVMTGCLMGYLCALKLSDRIMDIQI